MSRGVAPPHLGLPGVNERYKITIPIGMFEGTSANHSHRIASTSSTFDTLIHMYGMSSSADVRLYVLWSTEGTTTTDTLTFRLRYALLTPGTTATTTSVAVLDTAIAAVSPIRTASAIQRTAAGSISANNMVDGRNYLKLTLDIPSTTGISLASTVVNAHAVEVEYVRSFV